MRQSVQTACEPQGSVSAAGAGSLFHEVQSRCRHVQARQPQGLKNKYALPPIHPEDIRYLRTNIRRQINSYRLFHGNLPL